MTNLLQTQNIKKLILLFIALFTINIVSAQQQKAPLVNYKMEAKDYLLYGFIVVLINRSNLIAIPQRINI